MSCFPYPPSNTGKYHWFLRAKLSGVNNSNIQSATELPAGVKVPQLVLASEPVPQSDVAFVSIVMVCTVSKHTCYRNEWYWFPEMKQLFSHMCCLTKHYSDLLFMLLFVFCFQIIDGSLSNKSDLLSKGHLAYFPAKIYLITRKQRASQNILTVTETSSS